MSLYGSVKSFFSRAFSTGTSRLADAAPAIPASPRAFSSYDGSLWGGGGSKWRGGLSSSGTAPVLNHDLLRINSRTMYHESLQARSVIERHTDSVVDVGLKLNATPDAGVLGIDPKLAERWAMDVDARFDAWARSRDATLASNMNFYQVQRLAGLCQQRDGEYFVRFNYSKSRELLNPLQLGFLDPGQIIGYGVTNAYGSYLQEQDGIERDSNGKEIAYQVYVRQADQTFKPVKIPARGARSKRVMMIHGYQPEYPGQGRGYPRLSHALQELEKLTDYSVSELAKAISQSTIMGFVKPSKDSVASNPFEGQSHTAPVGPTGLTETGQALAEENNIDPADLINYIPIPEATQAVPGSLAICNLTEGEEIKPFQNTAPVDGYSKFVDAVMSYLAASLSIPLEVVLMKFNQNYSASRAALILFWRVAQIWRDEMASDFLNPVYENWLAGEIAAARISAPGWTDPRTRAAWVKNTWIGAPMPNIDPMRTAKANKEYVEMGAQTLDRVALEHNGSNGAANRAKLAREFAELPPSPWAKTAGAPAGDDADAKKEDDE